MANVTGDSAQQVSSYMTAIWNNYSQGADDLQHFGDVMADLGARTASSSSEIADGLQQFASIGPVVGLSFDYAASALATVSSNTRESANIIGNAFKSIFSRIQGLKLGETLEDGTDLNKYSQALEAVGISIKDEMGNLKDMDVILDEMMAKWGTLARSEQVALAQAVGGTHQYARLMSLMEARDEFYENLNYAYNSEGAIEEQLVPYEEAWTAAANQFQASLERLYESFEVKEMATEFYDFADDIAIGAAVALENLGGVKTLLAGIASFAMGKFSTQISMGFTTFTNNIKNTINSEKYLEQVQQESLAVIKQRLSLINDPIERQHLENYYELIQLQTSLIDNTTRLTEVEKAWNTQTIHGMADSIEALRQYRNAQLEIDSSLFDGNFDENKYWSHLVEGGWTPVEEIATRAQMNNLGVQYQDMDLITLSGEFIQLTRQIESASVTYQHFRDNMNIALNTQNLDNAAAAAQRLILEMRDNSSTEVQGLYRQIQSSYPRMIQAIESGTVDSLQSLQTYCSRIQRILNTTAVQSRQQIGSMGAILDRSGMNTDEIAQQVRRYYQLPFQINNEERNLQEQRSSLITDNDKPKDMIATFTKMASVIGQCTFALQSFSALTDTLNNPEISGWERFLAIMTQISFVMPTIVTGVGGLNKFRQEAQKIKAYSVINDDDRQYLSQIAEYRKLAAQQEYGASNQKLQASNAHLGNLYQSKNEVQHLYNTAVAQRQTESDKLNNVRNEIQRLQSIGLGDGATVQHLQAEAQAIEIALNNTDRLVQSRQTYLNFLNDSITQTQQEIGTIVAETEALERARDEIQGLSDEDIYNNYGGAAGIPDLERDDETERRIKMGNTVTSDNLQDWIDVEGITTTIQKAFLQKDWSVLGEALSEGFKTGMQSAKTFFTSVGGKITALSLLIAGLGIVIYRCITKVRRDAEAAQEVLDTTSESLKDAQNNLDEINSELDEINRQIEEIKSQGKLSLTDEAEINKLEREKNLLEAQQKATEAKLKAQQESYALSFEDNFETSTKDDFLNLNDDAGLALTDATERYIEAYRTGGTVMHDGKQVSADEYANYIATEWGAAETGYEDSLEQYQAYLDAKKEKDKAYFEQVATMSELTNTENVRIGNYETGLAAIYDSENVSNYLNRLTNSQLKGAQTLIENGASEQEIYEYFKSLGVIGYEAFYDTIAYMGQSSGNFIDWFISKNASNRDNIQKSLGNTSLGNANTNSIQHIRQLKDDISNLSDAQIAELINNLNNASVVQEITGITDEKAKEVGAKNGYEYALGLIEAARAALGLENTSLFDDLDINKLMKQTLKEGYSSLNADDKTLFEEMLMSFSKEDLERMAKEGVASIQSYINKYRQEQKAENVYSEIENILEADSKGDKAFDFDIKDVKNYAKQLQTLAKTGDRVAESLENDEEAAAKVSYAMQRMDQGVKDLKDNWEDWESVLNNTTREAPSRIAVLDDLRNILSNLLNYDLGAVVNGGALDMEWITKYKDTLTAAMNGSTEAIKTLQMEASKQIIIQIMGVSDFSQLDKGLQDATNSITSWLSENQNRLKLGATIDDSQFNRALVNMAAATGRTVAEIAKAWGFEVSGQVGYDSVEVSVPNLGNYLADNKGASLNRQKGVSPSITGFANNKAIVKMPKFTYVASSGTAASYLPKGLGATKASSGGGGSSGGGSGYKPDQLDDEFDKYHYYIKSLEDLANAYERVAAQRDRAYTIKDYDSFHNGMISNLKSQLAINQTYHDALTNELLSSKKQLQGWGVQFDSWGNMTNYYSWLEQLKATYQKKLNSAGSDENAEKIQKEYEDKIAAVERNQELHETKRDLETTMEDLKRQIQDENLNQIEFHLSFKTDEIDLILSQLDAKLSHLDHYELNIPLLVDVQEDQLGQNLDKLQAQYNYLSELQAEAAANGMTNDLREAMQKAQQDIASLETEIESYVEKIGEDLEAIFDNISEKAEHATSLMDSYKDQLSSMRDILDLTGQKYSENKTYKFIEEAMQDATVSNLEVLKKQYAVTKKAIADMEQSRNNLINSGADEAVIKQWEDKIKQAQQDFQSLGAELAGAIQDAISTVMEQMVAALEDSMRQAEMRLFEIGDLELAQSYYDEYADLAAQYLDDIEKAYELDKLMRDINSSIANTDNITGSKELAKLAEEVVQHQADGAKMSQYEVDLLNAKYQLTLAQIALEEAQNNKTSMRLRRDASGNYTYVYTADESAVNSAEHEVADKQKNLYDISKEYEQKIQESWLNILKEYEERVQELQQKFQDGIISESEFLDQKNELDRIYKDKISYVYTELGKVYDNSALTFENSVLSQVLKMDELTDAFEGSCVMIEEISKAATDNAELQQERVEEILESVGTSVDDLAYDFRNATEDIMNATDILSDNTVAGLTEIENALDNDITKVEQWAAAVSAAFKEVAALRGSASGGEVSSNSAVSAPDYSYEFMKYTGAGDSGTANIMWTNRQSKYNQLTTDEKSKVISQAALQTWASDFLNESSPNHNKAVQMYQSVMSGGSAYQAWKRYYGFDTGGYTGSWGTDGRLAVLHQKELVLNAQDTENILEAVKLIRSISSNITSSLANDVINLLGKTSGITNFNSGNNTVPQMISIEASFPNVSVASEIEQAFNSLADQAAQFASIKKI